MNQRLPVPDLPRPSNRASGCSQDCRIEENRMLGLWTAFIRRDGEALAVIVESDREDLIATARRLMDDAELIAA
jgi:hypothetical protein